MNELNHTPGKGDKDRSPGWRQNYDGIDFHRGAIDGFARRGNHLVKAYGSRVARFAFPENEEQHESAPRICRAESPNHYWVCTLEKGHPGEHASQWWDGFQFERWRSGVQPFWRKG